MDKALFSYVYGKCIKCEKPIEYTIRGDFEDVEIGGYIPPFLGMSLGGSVIVCVCGCVNSFKYDKKTSSLSIEKHPASGPRRVTASGI